MFTFNAFMEKCNRLFVKFIDYILLNAYSVNSEGLYNGRIGLSLCLFENARLLNDENLENFACDLLQKTLVSKTKNVYFENGLSGIGFVLLYLIKYKFIDADFNELFNENRNKIAFELEKKIKNPNNIISLLYTIYYLEMLTDKTEKEIFIAQSIIKIANSYFTDKLSRLSLSSHLQQESKLVILNQFELFLKVCFNYPENKNFNIPIQLFLELYLKGKISYSLPTSHYLLGLTTLQKGIEKMLENSISNIEQETLPLYQQIDYLYLLHQYDDQFESLIYKMEEPLIGYNQKNYEKWLVNKIGTRSFIAGYGRGVSRLLLYLTFCEAKRQNKDIFRFKELFL